MNGRKIAVHPRTFKKKTKIENPVSPRETSGDNAELQTPAHLPAHEGDGQKHRAVHRIRSNRKGRIFLPSLTRLFKLLKGNAKETLVSAVKEALTGKIYKAAYVQSLLQPSGYQDNPVHPQDAELLNIDYEGRDLSDYDELI